jgi:hypothetical protein
MSGFLANLFSWDGSLANDHSSRASQRNSAGFPAGSSGERGVQTPSPPNKERRPRAKWTFPIDLTTASFPKWARDQYARAAARRPDPPLARAVGPELADTPSSIASIPLSKSEPAAARSVPFVRSLSMAWSPVLRANAGIFRVRKPGDYANPYSTTSPTTASQFSSKAYGPCRSLDPTIASAWPFPETHSTD